MGIAGISAIFFAVASCISPGTCEPATTAVRQADDGSFPRPKREWYAHCLKSGDGDEYVVLTVDVLDDGAVRNIKVVEYSDECFVNAARLTIAPWVIPERAGERRVRLRFEFDGSV